MTISLIEEILGAEQAKIGQARLPVLLDRFRILTGLDLIKYARGSYHSKH
jgi:hypothetical protein